MEYTSIPNIQNKITRIGLGAWAIGGWMWGGTEEQESIKTILKAIDLGITLIDTAPVYGFGLSEEIVGKALKNHEKRDQIVVATKAGISWKNGKVYRDSSKKTLMQEVDASLKRLQVDCIDLYQVHWPDPLTPISEVAETFNQFLKAGKIRAIGVSNFSLEQMKEFQKYAPLLTLQSPYNIFEREIEKKEMPYCLQNKISVLGYGSLCRGLLTGTMQKNRKFTGDDIRKIDPKFQEPRFTQYLNSAKRLEEWVQDTYQKPLYALAVRYSLDKGIHIALWGARHPNQMEDLEAIWGWKLTPQDFKQIDQILKETISSPVGPEFMAPPDRKTFEKAA